MRVLTVIPTYNEADNIVRLIPAIRAAYPETDILVVDDASPDGTAAVVEELAGDGSRVRVLCREKNERGYGTAILRGLNEGIDRGYDVVVTLDADLSHDPADIPALVSGLDDADVVIGSRYQGGVRVLNWELRRLLLSVVANGYVRLLAGLPCADCTSGFRAYRVGLLSNLSLRRIASSGYSLLPEILFEATYVTNRIREHPVCFTERRRGASKMSSRVVIEAALRPWSLLGTRVARALRGRSRRARSHLAARTPDSQRPPASSRTSSLPPRVPSAWTEVEISERPQTNAVASGDGRGSVSGSGAVGGEAG